MVPLLTSLWSPSIRSVITKQAVLLVAGGLLASSSAMAESRLRIVAANITSGNGQTYDFGHGSRILDGLNPDVVLIQEFNIGDGSQNALRKWINENLGDGFNAHREEGKGIPNGVISRFPIVEQGEWDDPFMNDRDFAWAKLGLPNGEKLWAISVHLSHRRAETRAKQAKELIKLINEKIPKEDLVVLAGDFNTKNRKEECIKTLSAIFHTKAPYPADNLGDEDTNAGRDNPYDWVLADAELHPRMVDVKIGNQTFENGLVFDSRVFEPLGDVSPVREEDSEAPQMQHMAVVKDFVLP
jgi:endonuclease/exonuclease/phosphatase family metal-dependent hydrolase